MPFRLHIGDRQSFQSCLDMRLLEVPNIAMLGASTVWEEDDSTHHTNRVQVLAVGVLKGPDENVA